MDAIGTIGDAQVIDHVTGAGALSTEELPLVAFVMM
jgi:hypothetical protein